MTATLIVTAFGNLSLCQQRSDGGVEEDLYSVFLTRSELMGWCRLGSSDSPPMRLLWGMNEAEWYRDGGPRIGYAQVGLNVSPTVAITPVIQCLDDSLNWFGEAAVSAYEVTVVGIAPSQQSHPHDLFFTTNWFGTGSSTATRALLTLATDRSDTRMTREVLEGMQQGDARPFEFGPMVSSPDGSARGHEWEPIRWQPLDTGIVVSMPMWRPDSIGWVIGRALDAVLSLDRPPPNLAMRVEQTQE